jgi:hypothetical protein
LSFSDALCKTQKIETRRDAAPLSVNPFLAAGGSGEQFRIIMILPC